MEPYESGGYYGHGMWAGIVSNWKRKNAQAPLLPVPVRSHESSSSSSYSLSVSVKKDNEIQKTLRPSRVVTLNILS